MADTVLVTGGFGFIGGYVGELFQAAGYRVARLGRSALDVSDGPHHAPEKIYRGGERVDLAAVLHELRPSIVVHTAGIASVPLSFDAPSGDFRAGPLLLFDLLDAMRATQRRARIVFLSSAAVYGEPGALPISEAAPVAPISPYGFHKAQAELVCREFSDVYGFEISSARIFSAYGPGLRRQVIWDICRKAMARRPFALFGKGDESRDFVHVSDVAKAVLTLAEREQLSRFEVFNVGSGDETQIGVLAREIIRNLGLPPDLASFNGEDDRGSPRRWRADIGRLVQEGYRTSISLERGLMETVKWAAGEMAMQQ